MIELRDITTENHLAVRSLAVHKNQNKFVATIDKSLADAFVWKDARVKVGYRGEEAFGFVMIFPFEQDGIRMINIVRLMVDAKHQGQGLGRTLLAETIKWAGRLNAQRIRISTLPENNIALALYKSFGFAESRIEEGEIALYLNLS